MRRRSVQLGLLALPVLCLLAFWLLAPGTTPEAAPEAAVEAPVVSAGLTQPVETVAAPTPAPVVADPDHLEDGTPITAGCRPLIVDHRRKVPGWVLLDNLRARGAKFEEADIACITAAGLPPAVVKYAERHPVVHR